MSQGRSPITWVPTLYFVQGLPFFTVAMIAGLMFKSMGVDNSTIGHYTALLGFAWVFKPLWSPFLELAPNKKTVVVVFQFLGATAMGLMALALQLPAWFAVGVAVLSVLAIASATHDIAADGLYIASLSSKQQAMYAGWQGAFFNAARLMAAGGVLYLAGQLEKQMPASQSWSVIFVGLAAMMAALATYHLWALPGSANAVRADRSLSGTTDLLRDVLVDFFRKPGIWMAIVFIILFRAGEGQIQTIGPLFLRDPRASGGLGLSTDQVGIVYGTAGSVAFVIGSILGGYFTAWLGLRRALPLLILGMNLPNLVFYFLATALPTDLRLIAAALGLEMFGYGFGFVGVILYIMQVVAVGKYTTAHYALGTGVMQLGFVLFKWVSGDIQTALGYHNFFLWVLLCAVPVLLLSWFMRVPQPAPSSPAAQPAEA
ncbi:MAG TPA: MFS transporter [Albitalea sp.]|uniref:MFS transporter n=1 Tax=Piscinibacter sp. TaxID=1903157 RepID=UPI002ECFEB81